jgi:RNA ligase
MTTLDELFGPGALQAEIDAGHIRVGRSGDGLSIYNYTEKTAFSHAWNPVTLRCRGLVAGDATGEILAWPWPKFFNHSEHGHGNPWAPDLPDEPFEIYDKVDGSLGIVFWDPRQGRWRVATRGSFNSVQAQWAQQWLDRTDDYGHPVTSRLQSGRTYLAEIVFPENRIVVNHGNRRDLVLLGSYHRDGVEVPLLGTGIDWMPIGSVVRSWPQMPLDVLVEFAGRSADVNGTVRTGTDMEGYVLRYASGLRVKIKLAEYIRMHAILTGMNERTVWEVLSTGGSLNDFLTNVPDEFMRWIEDVEDRLITAHMAYAETARAEYQAIRKAFAVEAVKSPMSAALFRLYDNKTIDDLGWKAIKPSGTATFSSSEEG